MLKTVLLSLLVTFTVMAHAQFEFPIVEPKFTLISSPRVQEHLKMTSEQKAKTKSILDEVMQDDGNGHKFLAVSGASGVEDLDNKILEVFSDEQKARFQELYVQKNGYLVLSIPEFAKQLEITEDQSKELEKAWDHHRSMLSEHVTNNLADAQNGKQELKLEATDVERMQSSTNNMVKKVLTKAQLEKWKVLEGVKFDFKEKD